MKGLAGNDVITMNEAGMTAGQQLTMFAYGGNGNDKITGGSAADRFYGENGSDTLIGNGGHDKLFGAFFTTDVETGAANDKLYGASGNDMLRGGSGQDLLNAGSGNDILHGGDGDDQFLPGAGADSVDAGAGSDTLVETTGYATLSDSELVTWANNAYTTDTLAGIEKATLTASDVGLGYTYLNATNFSGSVVFNGSSLPDYFYVPPATTRCMA